MMLPLPKNLQTTADNSLPQIGRSVGYPNGIEGALRELCKN